ncbi:MAG: NfeD family protein [Clostridia bacterium]|nr:NfeD family protein [Clostridia bacterium]
MMYLWIAVFVLAITVEALTSDFIAIWFMPAAVVSFVLSLPAIDAAVWVQILCFVLIGLVLVIATRPLCKKFIKDKGEKTNADALIGKACLVTEEIRNIDGLGEVKVGGLCWSARAEDESRVIAVGEQVEIVAIQGVKLIVK